MRARPVPARPSAPCPGAPSGAARGGARGLVPSDPRGPRPSREEPRPPGQQRQRSGTSAAPRPAPLILRPRGCPPSFTTAVSGRSSRLASPWLRGGRAAVTGPSSPRPVRVAPGSGACRGPAARRWVTAAAQSPPVAGVAVGQCRLPRVAHCAAGSPSRAPSHFPRSRLRRLPASLRRSAVREAPALALRSASARLGSGAAGPPLHTTRPLPLPRCCAS